MSKELNLAVPTVRQAARFLQNRVRGTAAFFAARIRNLTVGAEFVAALDDRDVTAVRIRPDGERSIEGLVGLAVVESGYTPLPCFDLHQHLRQVAV